jgi:hypothetical protein
MGNKRVINDQGIQAAKARRLRELQAEREQAPAPTAAPAKVDPYRRLLDKIDSDNRRQ